MKAILLFGVLSLASAMGQPLHPMSAGADMIDGAKTLNLIPDSIGQRLYLLSLSHFDTGGRQAYVGNKIGLFDANDRRLLNDQITKWATAYRVLVQDYNSSGFTELALSRFKDGQDRLTTATFAYLRENLSAAGLEQLMDDYQRSKHGMRVANDSNMQQAGDSSNTQQMGVSMNAISTDTWVVLSQNPLHMTVTYVRTLEGEAASNPPGVVHNTTVNMTIGNRRTSATSGNVSPMQYVDVTASLTLDNTADSCLEDQSSCFENTSGTVFCTQAAAVIFTWGLTENIEMAWSQSVWPGTPPVSPPGCSEPGPNYNSACYYNLQAHCSAATTPPDFWVSYIQSGSNFTGASPAYWTSVTFCAAPAILGKRVGPYVCPKVAFSLPPSAGLTKPPYNCTAKNTQGIN